MPRNGRTTTPENQAQQRAGTPMPGARRGGAATPNPEPLTQPHSPAQSCLVPVTVPSNTAASSQPRRTTTDDEKKIATAATYPAHALLTEMARFRRNKGAPIIPGTITISTNCAEVYRLLHADIDTLYKKMVTDAVTQFQTDNPAATDEELQATRKQCTTSWRTHLDKQLSPLQFFRTTRPPAASPTQEATPPTPPSTRRN